MGSRINIELGDLLHNIKIETRLLTTELADGADNPSGQNTLETTAEVIFHSLSSKQETLTFSFDYTLHEGRVTLSADFNLFRYDDQSPQRKLLRALYENGISFTVHH